MNTVYKAILLSGFLATAVGLSYGQVRIVNSANNTAAINSSAFIDASSNAAINSSTNLGKGLLYPRVDLVSFTSFGGTPTGISSSYPTLYDGLVVYNTATAGVAGVGMTHGTLSAGFWYYDNKSGTLNGGTWKPLATGNFWKPDGNAGTTEYLGGPGGTLATSNYIGTSDNKNVTIGVNGIARVIVNKLGNIRAGSSNNISDTSITQYNFITGSTNSIALGSHNIVAGQGNILNQSADYQRGIANLVAGYANTVGSAANLVVGQANKVNRGGLCLVAGSGNRLGVLTTGTTAPENQSGWGCIVSGQNNIVEGSASLVTGDYNKIGTFSNGLVTGSHNEISSNVSYSSILAGEGIVANTSNTAYGANFYATGNAYVNGLAVMTSDRRFKSNIRPVNYGLATVMALQPKEYEQLKAYRVVNGRPVTDKGYEGSYHNIGFIAQDMYNVVPEAVHKPADERTENWGIDYTKLVPVLTKAIQEQQELFTKTIQEQQEQINALKAVLTELKKTH